MSISKPTIKRLQLLTIILLMALIHKGHAQSIDLNSRLFQRSKAAYGELDLKKAKRLCLKAMEKDDLKEQPDAQLLLANIYFAEKAFDESRKLYYKILTGLDITDDRRTFLQNAISRSQKNINHIKDLKVPKQSFEGEVASGIVNLNNFEKVTSLDSMVIYPGCSVYEDQKTTDKCFHYYVNDLISFNFDKTILKDIGINVPTVIYPFFTVTNEGTLSDIEVYAAHPLLELEGIRILREMSKLKPATVNGKPIAVKESMHVHIWN
ncbi:hypothetical protein [Nonlabens marinus]|uniref:Tetratricopeptide repeat protein n=1 Tax=Nonlabens marinus S1-08 TaxID=1454201 RepID=W8VXP5_9FLAO|nr:hypothetical protein [Nonlabens marinus]BAO56287.1 hypothetical protein NMS_2278 [Nonlabens marinus S1-08]